MIYTPDFDEGHTGLPLLPLTKGGGAR